MQATSHLVVFLCLTFPTSVGFGADSLEALAHDAKVEIHYKIERGKPTDVPIGVLIPHGWNATEANLQVLTSILCRQSKKRRFSLTLLGPAENLLKPLNTLARKYPNVAVVRRPVVYLGVVCLPFGPNYDPETCVVTKLVRGASADVAGVRPSDRILRVGGEPIADFESLQIALSDFLPDGTAVLTIRRNNEDLTIPVKFLPPPPLPEYLLPPPSLPRDNK